MSSRTPTAGSRGAAGAGGGRKKQAAASGARPAPRQHVRMIQEHLARAREEERRAEEGRREEEARRAEEERRSREEAERRAEEERRAREERRRKRQEEARKRAEREEKRRMEDARRRLGIAVPDAASGEGRHRRPVYESRKSKSQPKHQSGTNLGETHVIEKQLEDMQSNASLEDTDGVVVDVLELSKEQITQPLSEDSSGIDDDDAWENKSFGEFDAQLCGDSPPFGEEEDERTEEKHVYSAAPIADSMSLSDDMGEDVVSILSKRMVSGEELSMFVKRRILTPLPQPDELQSCLACWTWELPVSTPAAEYTIRGFAKFWVLDSSQLDFKFEVLLDVPEN